MVNGSVVAAAGKVFVLVNQLGGPYAAGAGYASFGAGNPSSKQLEHRNTNAILKIDLHPGATYGLIAPSYKGQVDQYELPELTKTPACTLSEGSSGVAIARHTVYVEADNSVVAYRAG